MGVPPTGKRVPFDSLDFGRIKDDKAVEYWAQLDVGSLMTRRGVSQTACRSVAPWPGPQSIAAKRDRDPVSCS